MSDLTPEMIAELERLLAEATPGPWSSEISGDGMYLNAGRIGLMAGIHAKERPDDAALCAAAVNALPALIAERERLRGIEEALRYIAKGSPWKPKLSADSIVEEYEQVAKAALTEASS